VDPFGRFRSPDQRAKRLLKDIVVDRAELNRGTKAQRHLDRRFDRMHENRRELLRLVQEETISIETLSSITEGMPFHENDVIAYTQVVSSKYTACGASTIQVILLRKDLDFGFHHVNDLLRS
jgi:hypothetical protein